MAICKTCGGSGAPQKGGPCVACLARKTPKAPFKSTIKQQEKGERRNRQRQQAVQITRAATQEHLDRLDDLGSQAADEILRRDSDRMQREFEMADVIKRNTELMEQIHRDLVKPSDDPEYLKRLQTSDAQRSAIANELTRIDVVPDGQKTWLSVGSFPHHKATDLARKLADHFEITTIQTHEPQI